MAHAAEGGLPRGICQRPSVERKDRVAAAAHDTMKAPNGVRAKGDRVTHPSASCGIPCPEWGCIRSVACSRTSHSWALL